MTKTPKLITWFIALLLGALGVLIKFGVIAVVGLPFTLNPFWVVTAGLVLLLIATVLPGL